MKLGFCNICTTTEIWKKENGRVILLPEYTELSIVFSDESIAKHAICFNCSNILNNTLIDIKIREKMIEDLLLKLKDHWKSEMAGWAVDKQFQDIDDLKIKAYDVSEDKAKEKYNNIKELEFQDHLKETKKQKDIAKNLGEFLGA